MRAKPGRGMSPDLAASSYQCGYLQQTERERCDPGKLQFPKHQAFGLRCQQSGIESGRLGKFDVFNHTW